jgi:hypothetical protein
MYGVPLGELPPLVTAFSGRDGLIEEIVETIVGYAEVHKPVTLVGPDGIGKTFIALAALHHDRIKRRFGENRHPFPHDKFPATLTNFLSRLSKATGTGVENPESLNSLLPFLSSAEMFIVLDDAESILDEKGKHFQETCASMEELRRLDNVFLFITSRNTLPAIGHTQGVPAFSMKSASEVFYRIYKSNERYGSVDVVLK